VKQSPRLSLTASLIAGYGRNAQLDRMRKGHPMDALELLRPVVDDDLDAEAELGGSYDLSPRDRLDVAAGLFSRGGVTHEAGELEPFQAGPSLYLGLEHALGPVESVGATFYGASTLFGHSRSSDGKLELVWQRALTQTLRAHVGAGAGVTSGTREQPGELAPAGTLGLDLAFPAREGDGGLSLLASYAPRMDPVTGDRRNRGEVSAAFTRALTATCLLRAWAGAAQEPGIATFALGGGDLTLRDRRGWSLSLEAEAVQAWRGEGPHTLLRVFTRAAWSFPDVL
jgi:hypothetical protein